MRKFGNWVERTPAQERARNLRRARNAFAAARDHMAEARRRREVRQLRTVRALVACARDCVRVGRRLRDSARAAR